MKRIVALLSAVLFLCACSPDQPAGHEASAPQTSPPEQEITRSPADASIPESAGGALAPDLDRLRRNAWVVVERPQSGWVLLIGRRGSGDEEPMPCRMLRPADGFDQTIVIQEADSLFLRGVMGDGCELEVVCGEETVSLRVEKKTFVLDFAAGTYRTEIAYRQQDLNRLLCQGPDGRLEVYATYVDSGGEWFYGDMVLFDTLTKEIAYLTAYDVEYVSALFCGEDRLLVCGISSLRLFDTATAQPLDAAFHYGELDGRTWYHTLGAAHDPDRDCFLVACRLGDDLDAPVDWDSTAEILLAVFDREGELLHMTETGLMMRILNRNGFFNQVSVEVEAQGTAALWAPDYDGEPVRLGEVGY